MSVMARNFSIGNPTKQKPRTGDRAARAADRGKKSMRTVFKTAIAATFAFALVGTCLVSRAAAQCVSLVSSNEESVLPQSDGQFFAASFAEPGSESDHIVGFWHAKFVSEGTTGIPDGTVIDTPNVQWHDDGTEIMNSTRAPSTGNICMGVWHKTGKLSYQLNHFTLAFDSSGNFTGPGQIQEDVTLDKKGDQYSGTYKIDEFDPAGNPVAHLTGNVSATRITVNTTIDQVL
jgi:hypothetical protein